MTSIVLATSNGIGMGHLTRQAAVALCLPDAHRATLFSLSLGLPLTAELGIRGEYCPSYEQPWIRGDAWDAYLRDRLIGIVEETRAEAVVFDGVSPYPGIGMASAALPDVAFVWLRRGTWQPTVPVERLDASRLFDLVIEPGDLARSADRGPTAVRGDARLVAPISLLEAIDPLPRAEARERLGLRSDGPIALVSLGSGRLGDVEGPERVAVQTLLGAPDWQVAITRSPIARGDSTGRTSERQVEIRGVYPLARYLEAFDAAIGAGGYNAVHELIPAGLPTLLVANSSTRTDDQRARVRHLVASGLALGADDDDAEGIRSRTLDLLDAGVRERLSSAAAGTRARMSGASETGAAVLDLVRGFGGTKLPLRSKLSMQLRALRCRASRALASTGASPLGRWLGLVPTTRLRVRLLEAPGDRNGDALPLLVTHDPTAELLRGGAPVEHLLPGSSEAYRQRRLELIASCYDIVDDVASEPKPGGRRLLP